MITIVLADDHQIVRQGLRLLLKAEADFDIIGEASSGIETADLVERLSPDVLVLDLKIPGINGIEVCKQVVTHSPQTAIVMLSMYGNEGYVLEALHGGAMAYVIKDSSSVELVHAIREAVAGRRYLSTSLSQRAIEVYAQRAEDTVMDPFDTLTPRQRQIFYLVLMEMSSARIASSLCISQRTVEGHRASIMHKLDIHSKTDLFRYALKREIIVERETIP